jgi:endonuclease/exonuclease/phosphatase family metal-dependent hydrolase
MRRTGWVTVPILLAAMTACGDSRSFRPAITAADLNFLHGIFCPPASDRCRLPDRVELLVDFIRERGCPDVVTLQEIWPPSLELIESRLARICPFAYQAVLGPVRTNVDDELVLSRYPVLSVEQQVLYGRFRKVLLTRIDHPIGPLDVFSTHLASGSDGGPQPCGAECPPECVAAGAINVRDCQAVQMALFIEQQHDVPTPGLIAGDFNDEPGSFVYQQFVGRGWRDVYLAAGNPECNRQTGVGCTSGREDEDLVALESPALGEDERIDFIFLIPAAGGSGCIPRILPADAGGGAGTRLFADVPNPLASTCGPLPEAICWPSDHVGVQVALACG